MVNRKGENKYDPTHTKRPFWFLLFYTRLEINHRPGIKRFVILPLLANILFLGGAFWWLYTKLGGWIAQVMSYVPDWQWLDYVIWPIAVILFCSYLPIFLVRLLILSLHLLTVGYQKNSKPS